VVVFDLSTLARGILVVVVVAVVVVSRASLALLSRSLVVFAIPIGRRLDVSEFSSLVS